MPAGWIVQLLRALNAPLTPDNFQFAEQWFQEEHGGPSPNPQEQTGGYDQGGAYNPWDTTLQEPGSTTYNSVGVQNYPDWQTGIKATVDTLLDSSPSYGYAAIVQALRSGASLTQLESVEDASSWGTAFPSGVYDIPIPARDVQTGDYAGPTGTGGFNPVTGLTGTQPGSPSQGTVPLPSASSAYGQDLASVYAGVAANHLASVQETAVGISKLNTAGAICAWIDILLNGSDAGVAQKHAADLSPLGIVNAIASGIENAELGTVGLAVGGVTGINPGSTEHVLASIPNYIARMLFTVGFLGVGLVGLNKALGGGPARTLGAGVGAVNRATILGGRVSRFGAVNRQEAVSARVRFERQAETLRRERVAAGVRQESQALRGAAEERRTIQRTAEQQARQSEQERREQVRTQAAQQRQLGAQARERQATERLGVSKGREARLASKQPPKKVIKRRQKAETRKATALASRYEASIPILRAKGRQETEAARMAEHRGRQVRARARKRAS